MSEAQDLIRLSELLEQRDAPVERVLTAVQAAGISSLILGVSALTPRLELLVTLVPEAIELVATGQSAGQLPARGMLRIFVHKDRVDAAVLAIGNVPATAAVDELISENARKPWLAVLEPLLQFPNSTIMNRTRFLAEQRAAIGVAYPVRDRKLDEQFIQMIERYEEQLGIDEAQRALWSRLYGVVNTGEPLSVSTQCTCDGPVGQLAVLHGRSEWDRAVDLLKLMAEPVAAREGAAALGMLAGRFNAEYARGLEVLLGPGGSCDLVVWLMPK